MNKKDRKILVLGASGYVGGKLVARLAEEGYSLRASGRSLEKLQRRFPDAGERIELYSADAHDPESLRRACEGIDTAFYLVHSMDARSRDFEEADKIAAANMARAAQEAGLKRIVYLGGLGDLGADLSKHLRSRQEVADILRSGTVPVTVFRAAVIIGAGSASYEIMHYLVDRLPVMITPRWVRTPSQPIAIKNVVEYLARCLEEEKTVGQTFDIGGTEVVSYEAMMRIYAEEKGLRRRLIIPVPVLTPRLSSLWIHVVTPMPSYIARPLAEGLKNPVICRDERIRDIIPQPLLDCREAIRQALKN